MLRTSGLGLIACAAPLLVAGCGEDDLQRIENEPPIAAAGDAIVVNKGDVVLFDGSGSRDPDGELAGWRWDFGDGAFGDGETASHIYNEGGLFSVALTVVDDAGATAVDTVTVTVSSNAAPLAQIDAPDAAPQGENVRLSGALSSDPDGSISTWSWDFGDGTTGAGREVDHTFESAGFYTVRLTVTDDAGAAGEAVHTLQIEEGPQDLSGSWTWFLVNEEERELGGLCGTFQDSALEIEVDGVSMSLTELAGAVEVEYTGTFDGEGFDVQHSGFFSTQRVWGTFTSATTFEGFYGIDPGTGDTCIDRAVHGVKAP